MPSLCLNAAERAALRGLPYLSRLVYLFGLRPFMDYGTGIVGFRRGVSWKSIAEELYIEPHPGIKSGEPSEKELRRALVWLQKAGLLSANKDGKKRLIFECLLASRDNCARKQVGRLNQGLAGSLLKGDLSSNHAALAYSEDNQVAGSKTPKVGTPPAFNLSNCLSSSAAQREEEMAQCASKAKADAAPSVNPALATFPMSLDWQPNRPSLEAIASSLGVSLDGFTDALLGEWRVYWAIEHSPLRQQTQQQWELQLVKRLKHLALEAAEQAQRAEAKAIQAAKAAEPSPSGVKPEKTRKAASGKVIQLRAAPSAAITETTQQQEQTMPSVQSFDEMMPFLWRKLRVMYGYPFERQYPTENDFSDWSSVLSDLTCEQILDGLRRLVEQSSTDPYGAYTPSAIRFRQVCLQIPGLPDVKRAWNEAVNAHYSHKAVEYAAQLTGRSALQAAKSGLLDAANMRSLRDRFEMNFQLAKERLQRGEPLQGREVASHEQAQQRQEAYNEYQRLKRMVEVGELSTANNALRQQATQARREAQALREQFNFEPLPDAPVIAASTNVQSLRQGRAA